MKRAFGIAAFVFAFLVGFGWNGKFWGIGSEIVFAFITLLCGLVATTDWERH